ncbi:MAG TPA: hemolysin family protein [Longimicrobium sp.]|jgi:putative hemolysin|nr:hemolysin family protein [Longimicrobium sp.]
MAAEILIILLLVLANGVFAMSEIAVVSSRRPRLRHLAEAGDRGARRALELAEAPDRFFATVQVGITLVGILTGAFGGATIAAKLAEALERVPALAPYAHAAALAAVVLGITYLSLIVGELVPKRIGMQHPERIAARVAGPMAALARLASPAVWVLSASTDVVLRVLRLPRPQEPPVTEAEIKVLLEQGAEAGVFEPGESEMVTRVFRLGDQRVSAVMTPRHRAVWLDADAPFEQARAAMAGHRFSRYLLCEGELDQVVGVVDVRDLWVAEVAGEPVRDLRAVARQPLVVPDSMRAMQLLERFRESGMHMALVVDEYGGVAGLATLNDILSEVAGDLTLAGPEHPAVVRREDGSWLVDGALAVEELRELLGLDERRGAPREYRSVGGWIFTELGRVPTEGDHFEAEGHRLEVVDMDGNRIDKVLVERIPD